MTLAEGNAAAAFGVVCAAGAATAIGSSIVFFPALVKRASRRVLAASLSLSAGVMIYVSFVEIFVKSVDGFIEAGYESSEIYIYTTLSFFGGVLVMKIVDVCVKYLSGEYEPRRRDIEEDIEVVWNEDSNMNEQEETVAPHYVGCSRDPVAELNQWHEKADLELQARLEAPQIMSENEVSACTCIDEETGESSQVIGDSIQSHENRNPLNQEPESKERNQSDESSNQEIEKPVRVFIETVPIPKEEDGLFRAPTRSYINAKEEKRRLVNVGLSTALAICLHNFPEGLATFVASLDDPGVGAVLAIAIGIHNIPEGMCVALPIYYATGNRWKAFLYGCLSGLSEPIAALLGWLVLANEMTPTSYGVLFGLVAGMMVMISVKELIPTAHRYDPEDTIVTYSIVVGMAIMGLSLVLFKQT